jgi:acetolactate synthase-1/2/3 large subunit
VTGGERLCRALEDLGVEVVFGLPGSQNVGLFEALRTSHLRTIVATSELAASFMANGYARATGRPGVLATIPGPGFTYALTGLAEAFLDSTPLLHILGRPGEGPGRRFQLQALDQRGILEPLVKRVFDLETFENVEAVLADAYALALSGEPGPVVVHVPSRLEGDAGPPRSVKSSPTAPPTPDTTDLRRRLLEAKRPLLYVGQGACGAAAELRTLVETRRIPLVATTSARGILPENHPWVVPFDRGSAETLNEFADSADLILALGCKFSHNGAHGFRLKLPADRLVQVDASAQVLGANYDAASLIAADAPWVIRTLLDAGKSSPSLSEWTAEEIGRWRERAYTLYQSGWEPKVRGLSPPTIESFFGALRGAMPADSCLVLDSGLHQMVARRYFPVLGPGGLMLPADLQAMGFALPASIGARIGRPDRPVVALVGDGGFAMSGFELLTAVREKLRLTVIVFNDGHYGLIRKQQLGRRWHAYGTDLLNPDFQGIAEACGARYCRLGDGAEGDLTKVVAGPGVTLVEVLLRDAGRQRTRRVRRGVARVLQRLYRRGFWR